MSTVPDFGSLTSRYRSLERSVQERELQVTTAVNAWAREVTTQARPPRAICADFGGLLPIFDSLDAIRQELAGVKPDIDRLGADVPVSYLWELASRLDDVERKLTGLDIPVISHPHR